MAYWDFEEGSGNSVADLAGGHDGLGLSPRWVPRAECTGEPADFKADGFVDAYDYPFLAESLAGPDVSTPPLGCTQDHFDLADLQGDNDVDRRDFAMFIEAVTP